MVSIIDLKFTLLQILLPELGRESPTTPFSGINIMAERRMVAFSQSMFALQIERSDPAKAITKAYSVTNNDFRLMASTSSDMNDTGGMEFFLDQWDYGNIRNLPDFCRLDSSGNIVDFGSPEYAGAGNS